MQLSEAQKRVLRTMYTCGCLVYVREHGQGYYCWGLKKPDSEYQPRINTLGILECEAFVERIPRSSWLDYDLNLTDRGREVAKELEAQDDPSRS